MDKRHDSHKEPTTETPGRLLSAADVAEFLGVPVSWVRTATRRGELPCVRVGHYIRYSGPVIENWVMEQAA
jgi:excisionase family DNA binding protein